MSQRRLDLKARIVAAGTNYRDIAAAAGKPYNRVTRILGGFIEPQPGEMGEIIRAIETAEKKGGNNADA